MRAKPDATQTGDGPRRPALTQADRERLNPYFRWLIHLGLPLGISLGVHGALVVAAIFATIEMGSGKLPIEVGEYEAGIIEDLDMSSGFSFDVAEELDTSLDDLESLDDLSLTDIAPTDLQIEDMSDPAESSGDFGLGSGEGGGILGIGNSGIGEAGSGGFGSGMGQRMRMGTAGVWNLNVAANRIAYVVDFSGSIITVVEELKRELKRSVGRLRPSQSFNVVLFYGTGGRAQVDSFQASLVTASSENKAALIEWLDQRNPTGGTEPFQAVQRAINQDPEAIFFFSDGRFDPQVVDKITDANRRRKAQILCLLFDEAVIDDSSGLPPASSPEVQLLRRLAEQNKGRAPQGGYKTVTLRDLYGG